MRNISNAKLAEALQLLEAAAKQKKAELKRLLSGNYTHLRDLLMSPEGKLVPARAYARKPTDAAALRAKGVARYRQPNPWPCPGDTAVVGFMQGYILGRKRS